MLSLGISLHDQDLRKLALKINAEHKLIDKFVASPTWVSRFKKYAGITSRRITTFTSTKNIKNKEKIAAAANRFVADLHDEVELQLTKKSSIVTIEHYSTDEELSQ